jgi:hypothetical protein
MRFVPMKRIVVVSVLAVACGLLLTNLLASSHSNPRGGALVGAATVSPFAIMMKASLNLPVEQYDSY